MFNSLIDLSVPSIILRLLMAVIFGGVIGLERGIKGRPAGMRTYMLVCMASTLVMCTNLYIANQYGAVDPTRMGAQVISGIGFLGVGTIIITRNNQVKGLTTAAGLWASACLGLAIGSGFYLGAIVGTVFIFVITTTMHSLDKMLRSRSRVVEVYVELRDDRMFSEFLDYVKDNGYTVTQMQLAENKFGSLKGLAAHATVALPKQQVHSNVMDILQRAECVRYIEEV